MQIFEFHFNPKDKTDLIFDSFCYEPENVYERKLGNLCIVGSLKYTLPQNVKFLDNLAKIIKEKYYQTSIYTSEKSLKETLKRANDFLEKIAKEGDVSWLGNLSFSVISVKDYELNFTKVGDSKIFLLRNNEIIDIDQKLKFDEIEPYPLKIFGNIVTGKLVEDDIILVLSKETAEIFQNENLLKKIANITVCEQKNIEKILDSKKEQLLKSPGICLLMALTKTRAERNVGKNAQSSLGREKRVISQKNTLKTYPLKTFLSNLGQSTPKFSWWVNLNPEIKNKIKLVFTLILFLLLGYFIFN